ncbi:MAG: DUF3987 domain-containing protein [Nitrospirae bacterium]|nr:DUF3987 domain-containing protein [Nitrospirota bacterium]
MLDKRAVLQKVDITEFYKSHIPSLKINGKIEVMGLCPFHDDTYPSWSVNLQSGLYHCFACGSSGDLFNFYQKLKQVDFSTALNEIAVMQGLSDTPPKLTATFYYRDSQGNVIYRKQRREPGKNGRPKDFYFSHPENDKWISGRGCSPTLYNLPAILQSSDIIMVEGEAHCDLIATWGLDGTTLDAGANAKPDNYDLSSLQGKNITILPDNDEPGRLYASNIANALHGQAKQIKIVNLPGLKEKGDIIDWAKLEGCGKDKLLQIIQEAPTWRPEEWMSKEIQSTDAVDIWPDPVPFSTYSALPSFPINTLPPIGQSIVEEVSEVNQVDAGLTASIFLCALSSSTQKKFEVDLLTHKEPLNLYICSIYESGNRKSSVMSTMTTPIYAYQLEIQKETAPRIAETQNAHRFKEARLQKLQKKAAQEDNLIERQRYEDEAAGIIKEMQENPVPSNPLCVVDDITMEALGLYMSGNGEKLSVFSPEGGLFSLMAGLYNDKGTNIDLPLKAYSGDAWSSHRVGRESRTMQNPALTMCLAVQPDVIEEIGKNTQFRGRGLLARFLYSCCKSTVGYRVRQKKAIPASLLENYNEFIIGLLRVPAGLNTLRLTQEAHEAWDEFYNDIEISMRTGGDLEYIKDWGSKLPGAVARIAGLLHFAEYGIRACYEPISVSSVSASCAIGSNYVEHAIAAFGLMKENPKIKTAKTILSYIRRHTPEIFKGRDVLRNTNIDDMNIASEGLKILIERGYIKSVAPEYSGIGRPEAMAYEVNPKIKNVNV